MIEKIHLIIGSLLERYDQTLAMRYYYWAMKPYNEEPLYGKWEQLWRNTQISTLIELHMLEISYMGEFERCVLFLNKEMTLNEYWQSDDYKKAIELEAGQI